MNRIPAKFRQSPEFRHFFPIPANAGILFSFRFRHRFRPEFTNSGPVPAGFFFWFRSVTILKIRCKLIEGSGFQEIISVSGISVVGAANALSSVHDIARARYVMQVVAASLYKLIQHAHLEANSELSWELWVERIAEENSNAFYCLLVLKLQKLILIFVTAQRVGNFKLYVASLQEVMKFIFILDHIH